MPRSILCKKPLFIFFTLRNTQNTGPKKWLIVLLILLVNATTYAQHSTPAHDGSDKSIFLHILISTMMSIVFNLLVILFKE